MDLLYSRKWNFLAPILKKNQEDTFKACKIRKHSEKISYILGNGTF